LQSDQAKFIIVAAGVLRAGKVLRTGQYCHALVKSVTFLTSGNKGKYLKLSAYQVYCILVAAGVLRAGKSVKP